jgi:hypothetical protein
MSRRNSITLFAAIAGIAMLADEFPPPERPFTTGAAPTRHDRTPEQSQERISARQERMARKLARRAQRAKAQAPGGDGDAS